MRLDVSLYLKVGNINYDTASETRVLSPLPKGDRKGPHVIGNSQFGANCRITPPQGRPQGSPPPLYTTPAHTKIRGRGPPAVFVSVASIIMKYASDERNTNAQ